jgi:hypothetical protein
VVATPAGRLCGMATRPRRNSGRRAVPPRHIRMTVVIPALLQSDPVETCLTAVSAARQHCASVEVDVVVCDSGGSDSTVNAAATAFDDVVVLRPQLGQATHRAGLMQRAFEYLQRLHLPARRMTHVSAAAAAAAAVAVPHVVFFLHAECVVPPDFFDVVQGFWTRSSSRSPATTMNHIAFCRVDNMGSSSSSRRLRFVRWATSLNSPLAWFGARGILVSWDLLLDIGVPMLEICEDVEMFRRAKWVSAQVDCCPAELLLPMLGTTPAAGAADDSNALMGRGVILSLLHRACIVALYSSGVPTATLRRWCVGVASFAPRAVWACGLCVSVRVC